MSAAAVTIGRDGAVHLPRGPQPADRASPDAVRVVTTYDRDSFENYRRRVLGPAGSQQLRAPRERLPLGLVHRPDNEYNPEAISVTATEYIGTASSRTARHHLGYLSEPYLNHVRATLLVDLAATSAQLSGQRPGVLHCSGFIVDDHLILDLPEAPRLGAAILTFLQARQPGYFPSERPRWYRAPRGDLAVADRRHTRPDPTTATVRTWIERFDQPPLPLQDIEISTTHHRWGRQPRSLLLTDSTYGNKVGEVALGCLFLQDERHRSAVLELLAAADIAVLKPTADSTDPVSGAPADSGPPNLRTHWKAEGLTLWAPDPTANANRVAVARYNPTTRTLWVEDSRLVGHARHYASRVGLQVDQLGLPRKPWALEEEIPYYELTDDTLRSKRPGIGADRPLILAEHSNLIPTDLLSDQDITWSKSPATPTHDETTADFRLHERYVTHRRELFGNLRLLAPMSPCRLCGHPAAEFETRICSQPLAYCQGCLDAAGDGIGRDKIRAARALRSLGELEFDSVPMLESQLASLHIDPHRPARPEVIDRLLLLRFAIRRKTFAWTLLLEAAGFGGDSGLRQSRGTLIRARDGHLCHSMREKLVCDYLYQHDVAHEREPLYPTDPDYNPHGRRRADWVLSDGTLVELWGLPDDPAYALKMTAKRALTQRHGLRLIEITDEELPHLPSIFRKWLRADATGTGTTLRWTPALVAATRRKPIASPQTPRRGPNAHNVRARQERLDRAAQALALQRSGLTRAQIGQRLGLTPDLTKDLLRDARFYEDPSVDARRAERARQAADARAAGQNQDQFETAHALSASRAKEAWRDAGVLHTPPGPS